MKFGKKIVESVGAVVTGATHLRNNKPCQDAIFVSPKGKNFCIVAIADGHGSTSCPYSDEGAEVAVKVLAELLEEMLQSLKDHKEIWLPKHLESKWKEEIKKIHDEKERETLDPFPYILYGTTLIAVVVTEEFVFALKIGDGNILMVKNDESPHEVFAEKENIGEETESLCLKDAWKFVRTLFIPTDETDGDFLIMLSTDGYANGFTTGAGFLKAGTDFYRLWKEEGLTLISDELPGWLRQSSDKGSGDDIALGIIVRGDSFE